MNREESVWRRAAVALEEEPEGRWFALAVHHGARVLLLLATAIALYFLFPAPRLPDTAVFERGVVAPQDVIAEIGFDIPKASDELLREQAEAASGVPPVYVLEPAAADSVLAGIRGLFSSLDSIASSENTPEARRAAVRAFMEQNRISPTPSSVDVLLDPARRAALSRSIELAIQDLYPRGIAPSSLSQGVSTIRVEMPSGVERLVARDSLLTPDRFRSLAAERLQGQPADATELQRLVLIRFFQPSLVYAEARTEEARDRARSAVDPVRARVLQGERIVAAHEQIGAEAEEKLRAYQVALANLGIQGEAGEYTIGRSLGAVLLNTLVLGIIGALLFFFRRSLYREWRALLLLAALILTVATAASVIARFSLPAELIPVTFAALIVASLWDGRLGLSVALVLAILIGGQTPFLGVTAVFTMALGGAAAAFSVQIVRRRTKTWHFISIVSAAYLVAALTMGLLRARTFADVGWSAGWGITNAVVASLLAIGFLPLLEAFTGITTDQTLLELSDLNRKLLKRLSLEAPGTYAHTIAVANLTEAAANSIGANGLLARVGTYYHDIGKLVKPQYYIENQPRGRNPHDKLKPTMSAAIIRSHVLEGLKLADHEKLPEAVKRFIPEHHGTQQITYFYAKARELDPEAQLNPADFSYPGPKPQIKETAILMLADTVESAARVLPDPAPGRIREMVDHLVGNKIAEGQLDQSPLTLREIDQIKESLAKVLTGMYHHRIDYPGGGVSAAAPTGGPPREPAKQEADAVVAGGA
ncbi:MAG TPA: HDIG domain-containing protein [Longimicrobiaceae bacterium]|nr:HDIG domain-containing protein [Longimicrobiaceae bacterium]